MHLIYFLNRPTENMGVLNVDNMKKKKKKRKEKKKLVRKRTRFLSDVQPPSAYKFHIFNGPINKVYILHF